MTTPRFGDSDWILNGSQDVKYPPDQDLTVEAWIKINGEISDVRITRGYARYGRRSWWRRLLARWFPWTLIHFHRVPRPES
jgi:hypothetical protein